MMCDLATQQLLEQAVQHHQSGRLHEAEALYQQILAIEPQNPDVLHLLGVATAQEGRLEAALELIQRSIMLQDGNAEAHSNLGNVLKLLGRLDESEAAYRRVIALSPKRPVGYSDLGTVLKLQGRLDEAIASYRQAVALDSCHAAAHSNLGDALLLKGQIDAAIESCRRAIALAPHLSEAHNNLGNALRRSGELDGAVAAFRHSIGLNPCLAPVHSNLGNALQNQGHLQEAIAAHRQAIALRPDFAQAHFNLGTAFDDARQFDQAISAYRQAVALDPSYAEAHNNLGIALQAQGQLDEAVSCFRRAIEIEPDFAAAHNNMGNACKETGELDEAVVSFRRAFDCDPRFYNAHSNLIFAMHYHPGSDARAIAEELRHWNEKYAAPLTRCAAPHSNDRNADRRLRIGYVSPNFTSHPVGRFLLPLVAHHDRQGVEAFVYALSKARDAMTRQIAGHVDVWRDVAGVDAAQVAALIRQDGIDVLVDLEMHTAQNGLLIFARKPAPVQVTYLAYATSSGLTAMDYRFSDPYMDPPELPLSIYCEKTLRLPRTFWCYLPTTELAVQTSPVMANGFVTFGCLNNFSKINRPLLTLWAQMMLAVPRSRLLMHAMQGSHRQRLLDYMRDQGIDASRIQFLHKLPLDAYFAAYHSIDIALGAHPYCGGTNICDALWMGAPVVCLKGSTGAGRHGFSILSAIGLPELAADNADQYVRLAVDLAADLPRLRHLRTTMRQRMLASPLMDAPQFARDVEAAYRQMWRNWCAVGSATGRDSQP